MNARREAILRPRVFGEFLRKYNGKSLPREDLGMNVLVEMEVPRDKAQEVFQRIVATAEEVGLITKIKDRNLSTSMPFAFWHLPSQRRKTSATTHDVSDEPHVNGAATSPVGRS